MDNSKAFSTLFSKLIALHLSKIFIRLLIFMYVNQSTNVRWNGVFSDTFSILNGVKQGMILSALFYCLYCSSLFALLKQRRSGCWINSDYLGILGYSDDNLLIAPTEDALQEMLETCEQYAAEHNLKFSTDPNPKLSKTRCLAYLQSDRELKKMKLCGNNLPWEKSAKHLGNKIVNITDGLKQDMREKRARYILSLIHI